ncbi:DUF3226 domain-containing protein [Helicobacter cetorum]|uniref:DUF3226 domain-containing protein n=1 Tax=Helicobacter cetorum TaxID=138563 RepID=UPI002D79EE15|nr:DUF3226 domain-containing protein [Helicobacter cetorum]
MKKIIYVEGESDKIFLMLLNKIKNLDIQEENIINCNSKDNLYEESESIKEYIRNYNIYIIFDSDGKNREDKIKEIKKQLQRLGEQKHRLTDKEFEKINIYLLPENDDNKHNKKYYELEHLLLEIMQDKNFYQHYRDFFTQITQYKIQQNNPMKKEQKKFNKCWLCPYITLSICLEKAITPCHMADINETDTIHKILGNTNNLETIKNLFNFDSPKIKNLIDFLTISNNT